MLSTTNHGGIKPLTIEGSKNKVNLDGMITPSDMKDPDDPMGRSYREVNYSRSHKFKIGQLVEVDDGVRMFVVSLMRDCDGTHLYSLSPDKEDTIQENKNCVYCNRSWHTGYSELDMKLVKKPWWMIELFLRK